MGQTTDVRPSSHLEAAMYSEIEDHVLRAAGEFRAAAYATTVKAQRDHREAAFDWALLIQCNGNHSARRILKARAAAKAEQGAQAL
jgi:hypothetical protein